MKIKEIPICSNMNQAPQQFTTINLSPINGNPMFMFPMQSPPAINTIIKPNTILSPAQNYGAAPFYIFTSQPAPTFNATNISPFKLPIATISTSPIQLGQLPINKILDTNQTNVSVCNRTIRDVLSSQKSPIPVSGKTSNANSVATGQPEVKKRRVLFKKPEVPSEKPKEVFVINSVATKCLKDQNKPVNVENIKEKLDQESIKVLMNDLIRRIENELEPKPAKQSSTDSKINITVKPATKKAPAPVQILPKMSTSELEKTIFDSIDCTLATASAKDIEDELRASSTPKKEQFKAGQRKRVIQHVDNSFVVMNRKDSSKLSEKRSKSMPDLSNLNKETKDAEEKVNEENGIGLETCPICTKTFQNEQKLKRHLNETHNEKVKFLKRKREETELKDTFITHLNVTYILTLKGQEKIDLVKKFDDPFYDNLLQSEKETSDVTEESDKPLSTSFDSFTMLVKQTKPRKSANTSIDCTPEMNKKEKSFQRRTSHLAKKLTFEEKKSEIKSKKPEIKSKKPEIKSKKPEVKSKKSEEKSIKPEVKSEKPTRSSTRKK